MVGTNPLLGAFVKFKQTELYDHESSFSFVIYLFMLNKNIKNTEQFKMNSKRKAIKSTKNSFQIISENCFLKIIYCIAL